MVLLLVDCRIPPTPDDVLMQEWLDQYSIKSLIVLTKADKLSRSRLLRSVHTAREALGSRDMVPFSAITGLGKNAILARIQNQISEEGAAKSPDETP